MPHGADVITAVDGKPVRARRRSRRAARRPTRRATVAARDPPRRQAPDRLGQARRAAASDARSAFPAGCAVSTIRRVLQPVAVGTKSLADYTHIVGRDLIEEIRTLAEPLQGKRVVHLSATAFGGGVSEILYTLVPLMKDVGLDASGRSSTAARSSSTRPS